MTGRRVIVLGGDGFFGWPCSLYLSSLGYEVTIIDSFLRRKIDDELGCGSLTPIASIEKRIDAWRELTGRGIRLKCLDISRNYKGLLNIINNIQPSVIIHLAEIRSAPYSMKSDYHKRITIDNNTNATANVLCAMVEVAPTAHLIHIGTAGVYGYSGDDIDLPEGYLDVQVKDNTGQPVDWNIPFPTNPGSAYHLTKCLDAEAFRFFQRNDQLRITDLHQGIIWGTQTEQTMMDDRLINRFDYDGDYGTVLNRFLVQSAINHPLTVHGTGGQTRAFIHLRNSVECVLLAMKHPPRPGDRVKVINQVTEHATVLELARKVSELTGAEIGHCHNPRLEAEGNKLHLCNDALLGMGLKPITLDNGLMSEIVEVASRFRDRCIVDKMLCDSVWRKGMRTGFVNTN